MAGVVWGVARVGGGVEQAPWTAMQPPAEVLAIHAPLKRILTEDAMVTEVMKLHFFTGFSLEVGAKALDILRATAYRSWTYARAWLREALEQNPDAID